MRSSLYKELRDERIARRQERGIIIFFSVVTVLLAYLLLICLAAEGRLF